MLPVREQRDLYDEYLQGFRSGVAKKSRLMNLTMTVQFHLEMPFGNEFTLFSKPLESESLAMTHSLFAVKPVTLPDNYHHALTLCAFVPQEFRNVSQSLANPPSSSMPSLFSAKNCSRTSKSHPIQ
jgi:hypothetical protein